jgi:hypothetical protein
MRTTTIHCDRCGSTIMGGHSVLTIMAGELATRHGDPLDLCGDCCQRFEDWVQGPRQTVAYAPGAIPGSSAVLVGG